MGSGASGPSAEKEPEEPEPEIQITDLSEEEKKRLDEAVKQVTNATQMKLFLDLITIWHINWSDWINPILVSDTFFLLGIFVVMDLPRTTVWTITISFKYRNL